MTAWSLLFLSALWGLATPALGSQVVTCTTEPRETWLTESDMRRRIADLGYQVDVFKTTIGGCYEIYGRAGGRRVEVYFDPRTGDIVRQSR